MLIDLLALIPATGQLHHGSLQLFSHRFQPERDQWLDGLDPGIQLGYQLTRTGFDRADFHRVFDALPL